MRGSIAIFCLVAVLAPSWAQAAQVNLNTQTCKDFMQTSKQDVGYTLAWLDGYYKDEDDPPIIDFDKLKDNANKLGSYCTDHPNTSVGAAAEQLFDK